MRILLVFSALSLLAACSKTTYTVSALPETYIEWGSFGGFTGEKQSYLLMPNGQIFERTSSNPEGQELSAVERKQAKQVFKAFDKSDFRTSNLGKSGNLTHFILFYEKEQVYSASWPEGSDELTEEINRLQGLLWNCIKQTPETL
jgi:hypothetical protein